MSGASRDKRDNGGSAAGLRLPVTVTKHDSNQQRLSAKFITPFARSDH
jgi:hypothetical protein